LVGHAFAGRTQIWRIEARSGPTGCSVSVTIRHGDTGRGDCADSWRVEAADGTVLGERPLAHPQVTEQKFTRSYAGNAIPVGTTTVYLRTRTNLNGWAATTTPHHLP